MSFVGLINKKTGHLQTHTLRYWESQFRQVKPIIRARNRRYYSKKDLKIVKQIINKNREFKQTIKKIVVGPGVHLHQRRDGVVILGEQGNPPTNHDQRLSQRPEQFPNLLVSLEHGQRIVNLAAKIIPQFKDLEIEKVEIGWRPLPLDGKPVVGFLSNHEYLATTHSGISLAPIIAELARDELLFGIKSDLLNDFRPQRF